MTVFAQQESKDTISVDSIAADSVTTDAADSLSVDTVLTTQQKIEKLLESPMFETSQVGMMVWNLDKDSLVFAHNERQLMRPASTLKLLTAITALEKLGNNYVICTQVYGDGTQDSTGYNGNIYIKGSMDPTLNVSDMDLLVSDVARLKTDTIRGRLVADMSFKDDDRMGKGWCWDDDNPVLSPLVYMRKDNFLEQFRSRLKVMNIEVTGEDSIGKVPATGIRLLGEHCTTLGTLYSKMLKKSDNLYAECVLYQLSAGKGKKATQKASLEEEKRVMRKAGLRPENYKIVDGSGLSLYNYLSPEAEVKLLKYAYQDKQIYTSLYNNLPEAGVSGTIKDRLCNTPLKGNVHAKTGTLTGVSSLAGYMTTKDGQHLAFCIINQGILSARKAKKFQDSVLKLLY